VGWRPFASLLAALSCVLSVPAPLSAQALFEQFNFQFSFSSPGARSKGMGQAFTAVANDASAAETSPGGLALGLYGSQPSEAMFEMSAPRSITRRAAAEDSFSTGSLETFGDRVYVPSFLGAVLRPKGLRSKGIALTAFYHDYLSYRESFELARRAVPGTTAYFLPTAGQTDLSGLSLGMGLGWRVGSVGLGVAAKADRLRIRTFTTRGDIFSPEVVVNVEEIDDDDWSVGVVLGGAWAPIPARPSARIGFSYSYNPRFSLHETFDDVYGQERTPVPGYPRVLTVSVPDRWSLGVADILGPVTAAADVVFDRYSELSGTRSTLLPQVGEVPRGDFVIRDVWSVHVGLDWNVVGRTHVYGGVFTAPTHAYRYTGPSDTVAGIALDYAFDSQPESTATGWSFGVGQGFKFGGMERLRATFAWTSTPGQSDEAVISVVLLR
jgi:hypothetical protein